MILDPLKSQLEIIPFSRTPGQKQLTWVLALLMFLNIVLFVIALAFQNNLSHLETKTSHQWTLQIPMDTATQQPVSENESQQVNSSLDEVLTYLSQSDVVALVDPIAPDRAREMLTPWIGRDLPEDLRLPSMINVDLHPVDPTIIADFSKKIQEKFPGLEVIEHQKWLTPLMDTFLTLKGIAALLMIMMMGVTLWIVVFSTRFFLSLYAEPIDLLFTVGANDRFVAQLFQRYFSRMVLGASLIAVSMTLGLFGIVYLILPESGQMMAFDQWFHLGWQNIVMIALIPVLTLLMVLLCIRMFVVHSLGKNA